MDRRSFLKGIVASAALPSFGRGATQQLSLNMIKIEAGATRPFSVLHISDTHLALAKPSEGEFLVNLAKKRTDEFGTRQLEALKDSIRWAKKNSDYLIHTGDIIDFITEANLEAIKECFGDAGPAFACVGNHEFAYKIGMTWAECSEENKIKQSLRLKEFWPFDIRIQSQVINGVNFVAMDDSYWTITEAQVAAFKTEVAKGLPIILLIHEPFMTPKIIQLNDKYWRVGKKFDNRPPWQWKTKEPLNSFVEYLRKEPLLKGILCGHLHCTIQDRFSPTAMQYVVGGNYLFAGQEVLFV